MDYLLPVRMERKGLQNCLTAVPNEVNILRFYDADVYMVVRRLSQIPDLSSI
jgi:hypothetical protein